MWVRTTSVQPSVSYRAGYWAAFARKAMEAPLKRTWNAECASDPNDCRLKCKSGTECIVSYSTTPLPCVTDYNRSESHSFWPRWDSSGRLGIALLRTHGNRSPSLVRTWGNQSIKKWKKSQKGGGICAESKKSTVQKRGNFLNEEKGYRVTLLGKDFPNPPKTCK